MLRAEAQHGLVVTRRRRQAAEHEIELGGVKAGRIAGRSEHLIGPLRIRRVTHGLALESAVPGLVAKFNVNLVEDARPWLALATRDAQRTPGIRTAAGQ